MKKINESGSNNKILDQAARFASKGSSDMSTELRAKMAECLNGIATQEIYKNHDNSSGIELNAEQLVRIDEVENAVFDFIKIMTCNPNIQWDISLIGEIADAIAGYLVNRGYLVYYPSVVHKENEPDSISLFFNT